MAKICTIYEVRYFYVGIAALGRHKGTLKDTIADGVIREELTRFNNSRSRKYNLPERNNAFRETPYNVLYELRQYGLVQINGQGVDKEGGLTAEGWRIYELLKNPANGQLLREEFAGLTLNTFQLFVHFIQILNASPYSKVVGIPRVSQGEFEQFTDEQSQAAIDYAVKIVANLLQPRFNLANSIYEQFRQALQTALNEKLAKGKKLSVILEVEITRFFTSYFFERLFSNQVQYEVIRTRSVFLGFANYYREGPPSQCLELVYPTCNIWSHPISETGCYTLPLNNDQFLVIPDWYQQENTPVRFVLTIKRAYQNLFRPTGYAEVADLRDYVCFELRIPDYIFDELLKQCLAASQNDKLPIRIYLDSSLTQPAAALKRAPLELRDGTFNLIRIHNLK